MDSPIADAGISFDHSGLSPTESVKIEQWMAEAPAAAPTAAVQIDNEVAKDAFGAGVKATDYEFIVADGMTALPDEQMVEARNLLAQEGVPKAIGNQMVIEWNKSMASPKTEAELVLEMNAAIAGLDRRFGQEKSLAMRKVAASEAKRMCQKAPWLRQALAETSLGNSAWLVETLCNLMIAKHRQ
jgi:hypothetical protein